MNRRGTRFVFLIELQKGKFGPEVFIGLALIFVTRLESIAAFSTPWNLGTTRTRPMLDELYITLVKKTKQKVIELAFH